MKIIDLAITLLISSNILLAQNKDDFSLILEKMIQIEEVRAKYLIEKTGEFRFYIKSSRDSPINKIIGLENRAFNFENNQKVLIWAGEELFTYSIGRFMDFKVIELSEKSCKLEFTTFKYFTDSNDLNLLIFQKEKGEWKLKKKKIPPLP